ncbi:unnamed protein product [Protopolystoma xenopodis]|uniref:Uncharacterized protein n=1 Tax=Protopolystoma xenopodis TaxID=117903 RepID=A0A3S5B4D9_9PLAT|nr:unnamed protein product [Protopolystoma xenopodis]
MQLWSQDLSSLAVLPLFLIVIGSELLVHSANLPQPIQPGLQIPGQLLPGRLPLYESDSETSSTYTEDTLSDSETETPSYSSFYSGKSGSVLIAST